MQSQAPSLRLVAGLGNPGAEYERTRHNVGFAVLDRLVSQADARWEHASKWGAVWAKASDILFVKPWTYMNRSGEALSVVAQFYKIAPAEILVVCDDLALPLGRLRIRPDGSSGGHNGIESVLMHFGTDAVPRLRVGIGSAPAEGAIDHVLGRFFEEERPMVEKAVARAAEAAKCAVDNGVVSAMNKFNQAAEL